MSSILVTGASGFIGKALCLHLANTHEVVAISRKPESLGKIPFIRGEFQNFEDLRRLDAYDIGAVVHLGAVTGGCLERDGMLVNVEGTRVLMRYLIDRGCRKFVLASSIAAIGMQSTAFRPVELPVTEQHPCLDRDGYGLSKFLMEEVAKYYQRQNPAIDIIALRLASICPDQDPSPLRIAAELGQWALGAITIMALSDAVRAFSLAVESPLTPGMRIMNAVGPRAWVREPTAKVLRDLFGPASDVSHYEQPGHEWDSTYDCSRIREVLGFTAQQQPHVLFGTAYPGPQC
jgi:UDP-glucose 4-epimerase